MRRVGGLLDGRRLYQVNSTARGGGVAEMLRSLVPYLLGSGVDCRWLVVEGNEAFFRVTKRLHNNLHGELGDGGALGAAERDVYEAVLEKPGEELAALLRPGDVVLLHDPQTAGLAGPAREAGATVVWRCHIGIDAPDGLAGRAWDFLRSYVTEAEAFVFSRRAFAWEGLDHARTWIIPPSIDAFSPKNHEMDSPTVDAVLGSSGLLDVSSKVVPAFTRQDGSSGRVNRGATLVDGGPPPPSSAKLVVQVSRWDRLKDPTGVMAGFAGHIAPRSEAHLIIAGPAVDTVDDDPEGAQVLGQALGLWSSLPRNIRGRIHLAALPMEDIEENAAMVNALQRRADVVVQKSLAEGFGLTVSEAMWKARPVVASRVGGIQDQLVDGVGGRLITNPADLASFGDAVVCLLEDRKSAARMGRAARRRVRGHFLHPRELVQHADLLARASTNGRRAAMNLVPV